MTGATTDASPSSGINNLSAYTFNQGATTITYTVTDAGGLSATCSFTVMVIDNIDPNEAFDYVVVIVRKNAHQAIIKQLSGLKNLSNIVFMGNNVLGFDEYTKHIDKEKLFSSSFFCKFRFNHKSFNTNNFGFFRNWN